MNHEVVIDHSLGLCGKPDQTNMTWEEAQQSPPKCCCCKQPMHPVECVSFGMQELGMFHVLCMHCPNKPE